MAMSNPLIERIWLESEETSGLVGLVNCLRQEPGGHKVRCVMGGELSEQLELKDLVMNVQRNGEELGSFRFILDTVSESDKLGTYQTQLKNAFVNATTRGDLSSLKWVELGAQPPAELEAECRVDFAALNFRDVMLATGKLSPEAIPGYHKMNDALLGMEFSGKTSDGKRCMGIVSAKGLATVVTADNAYLWKVPDDWSLEDAATVPVAYSTAYYSLIVRAHLKPTESVLIHAGSGAVGQAAIAIALAMQCQVFTTVSSIDKREFLKSRFGLSDEAFANSRDTSFEAHVMQATGGKGVDVVLNSLSGNLFK